jgi:hypothetical protein
LLLTGIAQVVSNNGVVTAQRSGLFGEAGSAKRRGIKQGTFLFLLTMLVVPIAALITLALNIEPFLPVLAAILFGVGGLLRVIYALMFESGTTARDAITSASLPEITESRNALPPSYSIPISAYTSPTAGAWRDTNDLQGTPGSVTDSTTKLLQEEENQ